MSHFIPLYIDKNENDHYLLFVNDEVGICGATVLTQLLTTTYQIKKYDFIGRYLGFKRCSLIYTR